MSKADICSIPIRSRRAVLAGIASAAAMPIAGIPNTAAATTDPIFAAIARHKAAAAKWDVAVNIRACFPDGAAPMTVEQRDERDELDDAVDDAWIPCRQAGIDLINSKPTTPAGIVAAIAYVRIQMRDDGTYMPHHLILET